MYSLEFGVSTDTVLSFCVFGAAMELWQDKDKLVARDEWEKKIRQLRGQVHGEMTDNEQCIMNVRDAFVAAVKKRMPHERFGVFFSGGVDSSLIALVAKQLGGDFGCYTVGFYEEGIKHPDDVGVAEKVARELGLTLHVQILNLEDVEKIVKEVARILKPTGLNDAVSVSVGAVIYAARELARKDSITTFFGGLGSEEIFAGYHRHKKVQDVNAECWRGVAAMWSKDLVRDAALGKVLGIRVRTPFLDEGLVKVAMSVPSAFKIDGKNKKIVLREVAEQMGLPHDAAWRKKQAAQYGSSFDKAVEKLAKKYGFGTKGEYLASL